MQHAVGKMFSLFHQHRQNIFCQIVRIAFFPCCQFFQHAGSTKYKIGLLQCLPCLQRKLARSHANSDQGHLHMGAAVHLFSKQPRQGSCHLCKAHALLISRCTDDVKHDARSLYGLRLFSKTTSRSTGLCHQMFNTELMDQGKIHLFCKGSLHCNDLSAPETAGFAVFQIICPRKDSNKQSFS